MTVNTTLAGLSQTPASNGPDGGADPPSALDDALRYHGAFIAQLRDSIVPVGGILMYSGLAASLTANWKICDGTAGTPDLRDKFIVGSGTTYTLGTSGGSADAIAVAHTHAVTVTGTTGMESADHSHAVIDPGHAHAVVSGGANSGTGAFADATPRNNVNTSVDGTGISLGGVSATHTHAVTSTGTAASTGAAGTNANLPPYYALAYIQRVS